MARYIDADSLLEQISKKKCEVGKIRYLDGFNDGLMRVRHIISTSPTADVLPKSEVDDLKRYIILNEDIAIKCKQENGEQNEEYWKGKISAFRQILAYIEAELKKKHTEEV